PAPAAYAASRPPGRIVASLQGTGPGPIRPPAEPPQLPAFVAPGGAAPPRVKPAAEAPQASDPAPPSLTLPAVTGDGQQRIAPLPDAPPPPAPEKSGVTGALRHAKRGLRRIGEKIIHR